MRKLFRFLFSFSLLTIPLQLLSASTPEKVILSNEASLPEQLQTPYTIYILLHAFNLNGDSIKLPPHCTLKFEGGSLSNGVICGNNTIISAEKVRIFHDIIICGYYDNTYVYSEWFDFTKTINDKEMQGLFKLANGRKRTHVYLQNQDYFISSYNVDTKEYGNILIPSNTYIHNEGTIKILPTGVRQNYPIFLKNVENITIEGGHIDGQIEHYYCIPEGQTKFYGIHCRAAKNVIIKNLKISGMWGGGICLQLLPNSGIHNENITIDNVACENNGGSGFIIEDGVNIQVKNCLSQNDGICNFWSVCSGFHVEPSYEDAIIEHFRICKSKSNKSLRSLTISLGKLKSYLDIRVDDFEGDGPSVLNNLNRNNAIFISNSSLSSLRSTYYIQKVF